MRSGKGSKIYAYRTLTQYWKNPRSYSLEIVKYAISHGSPLRSKKGRKISFLLLY